MPKQATAPEAEFESIPLSQIQSNPHQPRKDFDEAALNELALSIQKHGLIQPIVVRRAKPEAGSPKLQDQYVLIAGERRLKSCAKLGWKTIPAVIRNVSEEQASSTGGRF